MRNDEEASQRAKARWQILSHTLKRKVNNVNSELHSVRRFSGFDLFDLNKIDDSVDKYDWFLYTLKLTNTQVQIRLLLNTTSASDLIGFNNTGNVCVWPSEEVLTYYCHKNKTLLENKCVLELGCGMTGLAGMQIAAYTHCKKVLLTDGNELSVENMNVIVERNISDFKVKDVGSCLLRWGENLSSFIESNGLYDVVLCADCLFFVEAQNSLLETIHQVMKKDGVCIMFAPRRSGTLDKFVELAKQLFLVRVDDSYDEYIWNLHLNSLTCNLYSPDLHYPVMVKLLHL